MILPIAPPFWRDRPAHRRWLVAEADSLLAFYEPDLIDPSGGFANLDARGRPLASERARPLHETTRMVHCFAIAHLLGRPGAADIVDHGMKAIRERHRDAIGAARDFIAAALTPGRPLELVAEEIRLAARSLERIVGAIDVEQVLDVIFSRFCIGK